ncbi:AMP-binding protein [Gordonia sp. QH-12]|uniref:AMP-binding enzyme n=1 Tax=Gordonia sp. QH-12 TaxID=1437876 RepID=UPI0009EEACBB|nr:AMP-binding protein [Gordonia sp. QH-12]
MTTMRPDAELPRDEIIARNLAVVQEHFHNENPDDVDKAIALYASDISWEAPNRGLVYTDAAEVRSAYMKIFRTLQFHSLTTLRRFGTEQFVFDDAIADVTVIGDEMPNLPFPIGTRISLRLVHCFELRDGEITKEIAYEMWRDAAGPLVNDAVPPGSSVEYSSAGSFDPADYLALAQSDRVTHGAFLAPTMLRRLTDEVRGGSAPAVPHLRSLVIGGAALYQEDLQDALDTFGPIITQMYGQGECPMTIAVMKPDEVPHDSADPRRRSCGQPFTGVEVRVVNDDGADSPAGTTGEIQVRGDVVMAGYWSDPNATAAAISDGWLRTGDVGHFDENGFLYLTDRSKDVIISGGSNIYPREVEEVLLAHPAVYEAAVVGVPDPEWGENVCAFVVTGPGADVTEPQLIAHTRAHLASFKKPKSVTFLDELPKNANGKVVKRALRNLRTGANG